MAQKTIALPFSIDSYGKVSSTESQSKIWSDRVRSVLGTTLRERLMRPNFGTLVPYSLFNTETNANTEINNEVRRAFAEQLSLLTLQNVVVNSDTYTNTITVEAVYGLPNNEVTSTLVGLVLVPGANPVYEELL